MNTIITRNIFKIYLNSFNLGSNRLLCNNLLKFSTIKGKRQNFINKKGQKERKRQNDKGLNQKKQYNNKNNINKNSRNTNIKQSKQNINKNKSNHIKDQQPNIESSIFSGQQIKHFNQQISSYLTNLQKLSSLHPSTLNHFFSLHQLSNLSKFIQLQSKYHKIIFPSYPLSYDNRNKIIKMFYDMNYKQIQEIKCKNEKELLIKHEEICQCLYLAIKINDKKCMGNIMRVFLQYIKRMQSKIVIYQEKGTYKILKLKFINQSQQYSHIHQPLSIQSHIINLPISTINLTFVPFHNSSFIFDFISIIITSPHRSIQQFLSILKSLSKLLSIKELRKIDKIINQSILMNTFKNVVNRIDQGKGRKVYDNNNTIDIDQNNNNNSNKILTLQQLSRLTSILSQLSLKGQCIQSAYSIFNIYLDKSLYLHKQIYQLVSINNKNNNYNNIINNYNNKSIEQFNFHIVMKLFISFMQLASIDKDLQRNIQELMLYKFRINKVLNNIIINNGNKNNNINNGNNNNIINNNNLTQKHVYNLQRQQIKHIKRHFTLNQKQLSIICTLLHKFKQGHECFRIQIPQLNLQLNTNIWLQLYQSYQNISSIPQQFIFPLLSGIYRSQFSIIFNTIKEQKIESNLNHVNNITKDLIRKLYMLDTDLEYVEELELEKLIQFVLVVTNQINIHLLKEINNININNVNNYEKSNTYMKIFSDFVNKLQVQLNKNQENSLLIENDNNNQNSQMEQFKSEQTNKNNKKQNKQKNNIYNILKLYIQLNKAHLLIVQSYNTQTKQLLEQKKPFEHTKQSLSITLDKIKQILKQIQINQSELILLNLITLTIQKYLHHSISKNTQTSQHLLILLQFYNNINSFIGFSQQTQQSQYLSELKKQWINENIIIDELLDNQENINKILEQSQSELAKFKLYYSLLSQEFIRIKLVQNQNDFKNYSTNQYNQ